MCCDNALTQLLGTAVLELSYVPPAWHTNVCNSHRSGVIYALTCLWSGEHTCSPLLCRQPSGPTLQQCLRRFRSPCDCHYTLYADSHSRFLTGATLLPNKRASNISVLLQASVGGADTAVLDALSIPVDAEQADVLALYVERLMDLKATAADERVSAEEAVAEAAKPQSQGASCIV